MDPKHPWARLSDAKRMNKSRIFWKFFIGFFLATLIYSVTNIISLNFRIPPTDLEKYNLIVKTINTVGMQEALPLFEFRTFQSGKTIQLTLTDKDNNFITGDTFSNGYQQQLETPDGREFILHSSIELPDRVNYPAARYREGFLVVIISLIFSGIMAWYFSTPLLTLREALKKMGSDNFKTRINPKIGFRNDELTDLAVEFDSMADRIESLINSQKILFHNISHELRSPLARLQAALDLYNKSPDNKSFLKRIQLESDRIDNLIDKLLTMAKLESKIDEHEFENIDLIELLTSIIEDLEIEANQKEITLEFIIHGEQANFICFAYEEALYQAFENVIRNAIKFSYLNSKVTIEASQKGRNLLKIDISDHGPIVDPKYITEIFKPFKRYSSNYNEGFGLGLAIAKNAIELCGGSIHAENNKTSGLKLLITLPKN